MTTDLKTLEVIKKYGVCQDCGMDMEYAFVVLDGKEYKVCSRCSDCLKRIEYESTHRRIEQQLTEVVPAQYIAWNRDLYPKQSTGIARQFFSDIRTKEKMDVPIMAYLYGESDLGKTRIAYFAVTHLICKGHKVKVIGMDFEVKMRSLDRRESSTYLHDCQRCEILMMDDFYKSNGQDLEGYWLQIVAYRFERNLSTIITSNETPNSIIQRSANPEAFGKPIANRINKNFKLYPFGRKNEL